MHYSTSMDCPDDHDDTEVNDMVIEGTDEFDPDNMCKYNTEEVFFVQHLKGYQINISYNWYIIF